MKLLISLLFLFSVGCAKAQSSFFGDTSHPDKFRVDTTYGHLVYFEADGKIETTGFLVDSIRSYWYEGSVACGLNMCIIQEYRDEITKRQVIAHHYIFNTDVAQWQQKPDKHLDPTKYYLFIQKSQEQP